MIKKISIKTKFGWISAFEDNGKIFKIRFGKVKKQNQSFGLKKFKCWGGVIYFEFFHKDCISTPILERVVK